MCSASTKATDFIIYTSYQSQGSFEDKHELQIWEAARATLATSYSFDLTDGGRNGQVSNEVGTGVDSPLQYLWDEASHLWCDPLEVQIQCLVSIGAQGPTFPSDRGTIGLANSLFRDPIGSKQMTIAYEEDLAQLKNSDRYFHFNLDGCLDGVGLGNNSKFNRIVPTTRTFIRSEDVYPNLKGCATKLADKPSLKRPSAHHG